MRKHKKKRERKGLRVDVRNNNVEWALKKRDYYHKPSAVKREKKSAQAARHRYQAKKDKFSY